MKNGKNEKNGENNREAETTTLEGAVRTLPVSTVNGKEILCVEYDKMRKGRNKIEGAT